MGINLRSEEEQAKGARGCIRTGHVRAAALYGGGVAAAARSLAQHAGG